MGWADFHHPGWAFRLGLAAVLLAVPAPPAGDRFERTPAAQRPATWQLEAAGHALDVGDAAAAVHWARLAILNHQLPPERMATAQRVLGLGFLGQRKVTAAREALLTALSVSPPDNAAACTLLTLIPDDPGLRPGQARFEALCPP